MADFNKLYAEVMSQGRDAAEQARFVLEDKANFQLEHDQWRQYLSKFDRDVRNHVSLQQPPPHLPAGV